MHRMHRSGSGSPQAGHTAQRGHRGALTPASRQTSQSFRYAADPRFLHRYTSDTGYSVAWACGVRHMRHGGDEGREGPSHAQLPPITPAKLMFNARAFNGGLGVWVNPTITLRPHIAKTSAVPCLEFLGLNNTARTTLT